MESLERQRFRFEQFGASTARRERRRKEGALAVDLLTFDTREAEVNLCAATSKCVGK